MLELNIEEQNECCRSITINVRKTDKPVNRLETPSVLLNIGEINILNMESCDVTMM